jgi:hypothetical protein
MEPSLACSIPNAQVPLTMTAESAPARIQRAAARTDHVHGAREELSHDRGSAQDGHGQRNLSPS